jgi:hypothetical protein
MLAWKPSIHEDRPMPEPAEPVAAILAELAAARADFMVAIDDVDPALLTAPGLAGEWSARELIAHLGYWSGHAAEAIHRAEGGDLGTFGEDELSVDERNEVVARVAGESTMTVVRRREQAAYDALIARLATVDPEWLDESDADGDTLREILAYDGADHFREHTVDVRAWFSGATEPDDEDDA